MLLAAAVRAETPPDFLKWMDGIAQKQLQQREKTIASIRTVADAEQRKRYVRAKILELIGGLPRYDGPLNARVTGALHQPGYVIEKLIFESFPRYYITANVYRPEAAGRYPAVLLPLGHWEFGKPAAQRIAANLALKGFVALAFDPVGQGERLQAYDPRTHASLAGGSTEQHILAGAHAELLGQSFARYRIWDAKRALDYLVSRPDVDPERIGCTGCSGGGTVTTYLSAVDGRIKAAAPACYINSFTLLFSGPTGDSEQSLPGFLSSGLDIADYIELFAPKPWLISSTSEDFFPLAGAKRAYEEAERWYGIYDARSRVKWVVGPGGHGTPLPVRQAIYEWMIRWLKDGKGEARENESIALLPEHELWASEKGQVGGRELFEVMNEQAPIRAPFSRDALLAFVRRAIEQAPPYPVRTEALSPTGTGRKPGVLLVAPSERPEDRPDAVVMTVTPRGLPADRTQRYSGDWITNTRAELIGQNLPAMRARDIVDAARQLAAREDVDPSNIRAEAGGIAGIWLLLAAAAEPRIRAVSLTRTPYSFAAALHSPLHRDLHDAVLPGFALYGDLKDLAEALQPRTVTWIDPVDWTRSVVPLQGPLYRHTPALP